MRITNELGTGSSLNIWQAPWPEKISGKGKSSIQMRVIVLQLSIFAATMARLESVGD
jgi:hypothetical protein